MDEVHNDRTHTHIYLAIVMGTFHRRLSCKLYTYTKPTSKPYHKTFCIKKNNNYFIFIPDLHTRTSLNGGFGHFWV